MSSDYPERVKVDFHRVSHRAVCCGIAGLDINTPLKAAGYFSAIILTFEGLENPHKLRWTLPIAMSHATAVFFDSLPRILLLDPLII